MEDVEAIVDAAEGELRRGEPLAAYNTTLAGLERSPKHTRLRQLQALALARSGDVERANAILSTLAAEGLDDAETFGMLARTHKDLALRASGAARAAHLRSGFELYERAYHAALASGDPNAAGYTGINAATMAVLRGDIARARELAAEVRAAHRGVAASNYWGEATLGEAALIMGEIAAAREHYARATGIAGRRYGDLGTTRKQARLLEAHLPPAEGSASDALSIPPVVVFSGHMIDAPDRATPRFPPALESEVRASIRARLAQLAPAAVYGSAACGADLLCLEAAHDMGCETHVVLPFPAAAFRAASVDYAGADWGERFEHALAAADSVTIASDHHARGSTASFEYANLILTGMARLRGRILETRVRALAVLDPRAPGARGGTASIVSLWERHGLEVDTLDVKAARAARAPAPQDAASAAGATPPHGVRHEMRALLFADAVGYSRFTEDQIPLYITEFLGAVAALSRSSSHRYEHVETAGDGLYMVFGDVRDAAHFALELSALAGGTDWVARGLPAGFNLRIALHCGPVHCGRDPLTGSAIYTGPHTSRAARIEPITPPGQVYASQAFAAVAAARDTRELDLRYVGPVALAKGYGTLSLYHVASRR